MTTQVIPISRLDSLEKLNEALTKLVARGEAIEVKDAASDLEAKQFKIECDSYEKAVDLLCDPEIVELRERTSKAVASKKVLLDPVLRVKKLVIEGYRAWEEAERKAAEKEQAKLNKGGKEASLASVKPSIPTLQGAQSRRLYKVQVVDQDAILFEFIKAKRGKTNKDKMRAMFLRSYIRVDEAAIQAVARSEKGWKELQEAKVPGLRFWTE